MEQGKGGGAQPWRGQGRSGRDVLGAEGPKIAMNDSIKAVAEPTDDQNPPAPPRKKARVASDGAAECCSSCGTPWNVSDQEEWLRNAFYTNFRNGDAATIQRVREFWKEHVHEWIDDVEDEECNDEFHDAIPRSMREVVDIMMDERSTLFYCEDCNNSSNGTRCFRNRKWASSQTRV